MEHTVVVLYRQALAHYNVVVQEDGSFTADLLQYKGNSHDLPPPSIHFKKTGRHCTGDTDDQDLMDDLCDAMLRKITVGNDATGVTNIS